MIKMKISGLGATIQHFNEYEASTVENVQKQLVESGENIRAAAKAKAPKKSGKLRGDIRLFKKLKDFFVKVTYMGKGRAYWGKFVEFGTSKQESQPFMGPAVDAEVANFEQGMAKAIKPKGITG